ncbi:hypothetical protein LBMAG47_07810 [Planctomycetia bacterium]|nr:hypothetical protein LBMAG47_07810 [Planctomycetia bacterium]
MARRPKPLHPHPPCTQTPGTLGFESPARSSGSVTTAVRRLAWQDRAIFQASPDELPVIDIHILCRDPMSRCGETARRAVSRPACADTANPALSVDRKLLGSPKRVPHPALTVESHPQGSPWRTKGRFDLGEHRLLGG